MIIFLYIFRHFEMFYMLYITTHIRMIIQTWPKLDEYTTRTKLSKEVCERAVTYQAVLARKSTELIFPFWTLAQN